MFPSVSPTRSEVLAALPGDELVDADVVMDRAFTVSAAPEQVWPWIVQLGKGRGGWYLQRRAERLLPRRALRHLDPRWQELAVGAVVPDYGRNATLVVASIDPHRSLVYTSDRGRTAFSWAIVLRPTDAGTRLNLRLRMGPVTHVRLASVVGGLFDEATIAGMAAGLRERV